MVKKLTSRKFWICIAAFLGSVATSIAGITVQNDDITSLGIICGIISAGIYSAAEAYVDGAAVKEEKDEDKH